MGFFSKGITLPKRQLVTSLSLLDTPVPDKVVLPLRQYIGRPSRAAVAVGDTVKVGEVISACEDIDCLPVHASISGTVTDVSSQLDPRGSMVESVTIESDGADRWIEPPHAQDRALEPADMLAVIRSSGLLSKGVLPVPLDKDLLPVDQPKTHLYLDGTDIKQRIDTLIISCLDAEPSLGVNRYLAGMEHSSLPCGIDTLKRITGAERVIFAVDKHFAPSPQLKTIVEADEEEATSIVRVNGRRYPASLPLVLVKDLLGREVPLPYGHPRDVGAAVYDMETVISIAEAVTGGKAQVDTLITIGGDAVAKQGIARVRIGTSIGSLIDSLGGLKADAAKIILGGPMTGMAHYDLATPVTKEVVGLFAMTREQIRLSKDYRECINCGMCVKVCPVNLLPGIISLYCAKDKFDLAEAEGLFSCIECGACDYVCPSRRPLVHLFRHAKNQLME